MYKVYEHFPGHIYQTNFAKGADTVAYARKATRNKRLIHVFVEATKESTNLDEPIIVFEFYSKDRI